MAATAEIVDSLWGGGVGVASVGSAVHEQLARTRRCSSTVHEKPSDEPAIIGTIGHALQHASCTKNSISGDLPADVCFCR